MDSSRVDWEKLTNFFESKIKISPNEFNSEEFEYPESISERTLRNNRSNLRFHLLRHYIQSNFQNIDPLDSENHKKILQISKALDQPSKHRNLNLKIIENPQEGPSTPPRKRKRRYENDDEDFVDDEKYSLKKEIERLKRRNEFLEDENRKLRAQKGPFELQSYNKVWPKLCLKS